MLTICLSLIIVYFKFNLIIGNKKTSMVLGTAYTAGRAVDDWTVINAESCLCLTLTLFAFNVKSHFSGRRKRKGPCFKCQLFLFNFSPSPF